MKILPGHTWWRSDIREHTSAISAVTTPGGYYASCDSCSFRCRLVKSLTAHSQKVASYNLEHYSQIRTRITYVTAYVSSRPGQNVERFRNMIDPDTVQTRAKPTPVLADIHRLGVIHQNIHPDAIILMKMDACFWMISSLCTMRLTSLQLFMGDQMVVIWRELGA